MLGRALDESYPPEVRQRVTLLTVARACANACFRFAPPFLATIAAGQHVTLDRIGMALGITELAGLFSPITARVGDRMQRRTALSLGLAIVGLATISAAASTNLVWFTLSIMVMAQSKAMFDLGLGAWISDRVGFERRGRVMALTETAWAVGLLLGVTAMGLVTAAVNWRVGYLLGAVSVLGLAAAVRALLPVDTAAIAHARQSAARTGRMPRDGWVLIGGVFCLMFATQCLFVTFGSWLKDHFGFTDTGVSIVVFGLGFGELLASLASARFVDHWGKERSTIIGVGVMVPSALVLAVGHGHLLPGLVGLVLAIGAFEFAVVCVFPITTEMIAGAPARGIALAFTFGTLGRATASFTATRLYTRHGMMWPALLCATFAVGTALAVTRYQRARVAARPVA